jgi:AraC-like DNA-binding protein
VPVELFDIDNGYYVFSKGDYKTKKHSHYAIEMVCCGEGSFRISTALSKNTNLKSVIIPPNLPHDFDCLGAECDLLFVDPLSQMGKYFIQRFHLPSCTDIIVNPVELQEFQIEGKFDVSSILKESANNSFTDLDFRILQCIETIDSLITNEEITVSELSKASFLSESRLAHLFKMQLGISVHQCILWKKIVMAALKSREGYSLTECAHYVGFSDSSHFNKVFYKMFGINPFFVLRD